MPALHKHDNKEDIYHQFLDYRTYVFLITLLTCVETEAAAEPCLAEMLRILKSEPTPEAQAKLGESSHSSDSSDKLKSF